MPVLVDGNNLLHRLPASQRSREAVRRGVLDLVRREGVKVTVVFDGPPPSGTPQRELLGSVTVEYAGPRTADEVILHRVGGVRTGQITVVTDDRELARRARVGGAEVRAVASWLEKLRTPPREKPDDVSPSEVAEWEAFFATGEHDDEA